MAGFVVFKKDKNSPVKVVFYQYTNYDFHGTRLHWSLFLQLLLHVQEQQIAPENDSSSITTKYDFHGGTTHHLSNPFNVSKVVLSKHKTPGKVPRVLPLSTQQNLETEDQYCVTVCIVSRQINNTLVTIPQFSSSEVIFS